MNLNIFIYVTFMLFWLETGKNLSNILLGIYFLEIKFGGGDEIMVILENNELKYKISFLF